MRASDLTMPAYTKQEKENSQAMAIYRQYEKYLRLAKKNKEEYLDAKKLQQERTSDSLDKIVALYKESAIEYWEKSQKFLEEYNEFEKNRKYPNK